MYTRAHFLWDFVAVIGILQNRVSSEEEDSMSGTGWTPVRGPMGTGGSTGRTDGEFAVVVSDVEAVAAAAAAAAAAVLCLVPCSIAFISIVEDTVLSWMGREFIRLNLRLLRTLKQQDLQPSRMGILELQKHNNIANTMLATSETPAITS